MVATSPVHTPESTPTPIEAAQAKAREAARAGGKSSLPIRFNIPSAEEFDEAECEYLPGPDISYVARRVLEDVGAAFTHIDLADVDFAWKRKGGKKNGKPKLGECVKQNDIAKLHGARTWLIWLAADNCASLAGNEISCRAVVDHELSHIGFEYSEQTGDTVPKINPHDVEMFWGEYQRYGPWRLDLTVAENVFRQQRMPGI